MAIESFKDGSFGQQPQELTVPQLEGERTTSSGDDLVRMLGQLSGSPEALPAFMAAQDREDQILGEEQNPRVDNATNDLDY